VLSADEIEQMLASHQLYLKTEYREGHRADFSSADLTGLDFAGLDLRGIKMDRAVLRRATFIGANLRGANLHSLGRRYSGTPRCRRANCWS